ncbi:unnamed protein product [Symbiodinium sp. CCMP2456]|nr:unnamed protein product [Symbiodinium sp. CCMP2456]
MGRGAPRGGRRGSGKGQVRKTFAGRAVKQTPSFFQKQAKPTARKIPAVHMDETWHQKVRRVYPGESAAAFVRKGGLSNDMEVLSPAQFGPQLTHLNCEGANRLGNFMSMLAAAIETGHGLLQMQHNEPEKSGMEQLRAVFDEDDGTLLQAAQLLNLSNKQEASPQELQNAILQVFTYMANDACVKPWQRLAKFSSHLYNFAMLALQGHALMTNRPHWSAELAMQLEAMPASMRKFIQDPANDEALLQAALDCYQQQIQGAGGVGPMPDVFGDADDCADAPEEEDQEMQDDVFNDSKPARAAESLFGGKNKSPAAGAAVRDRPSVSAAPFAASLVAAPKITAKTKAPPSAEPTPTTSVTEAEAAMEKRRKEFDLWPLKALATFEHKPADAFLERLNLIPAKLRASAGLPCGNVQEADIGAELEQHSETMNSLHEEAKKHWLSKAELFTNERHKFHLDEDMAHTGILIKLVENDKVPPEVNAERLQELCALEKWDDAEEEEVADMQKAFLTCVLPVADAIALFDTVHDIVLQAAGKYEPTANQMKDALQRIPQSLRAGLALSRPEKYRAIKNKDWREDLNIILAVAFASLSAHWEA